MTTDVSPDALDGWEHTHDRTVYENVVAMIEASPAEWGLPEYKAFAFRYIPGGGPAVVANISEAYSLADFM